MTGTLDAAVAKLAALSPDEQERVRGELLRFARHVTPKEALDAVPSDKTDNRILECAVAADSETVVTGDRHLLSQRRFPSGESRD